LLAVAIDLSEVDVGKLAPLLLDLASHLLPVAFDAIPIHAGLHSWCCLMSGAGRLPQSKRLRPDSVPLKLARGKLALRLGRVSVTAIGSHTSGSWPLFGSRKVAPAGRSATAERRLRALHRTRSATAAALRVPR